MNLKGLDLYIYAIDGDDIGRNFERILLIEGLEAAIQYSKYASEELERIANKMRQEKASIKIIVGDSILACSDRKINLDTILHQDGIFKFSAGISTTTRGALIGLKLAKASGKSRVVFFEE